jgi:plastocyanin
MLRALMVPIYIGASGLSLYPRPRPERACRCYNPAAQPHANRSATRPMPAAARRLPRLLALAVTVALLGALLVAAGSGPAAAQAQPAREEVTGTAQNRWDPAEVRIRPRGTVVFTVGPGAVTHPVVSGTGTGEEGDNRFDDDDCVLDKMQQPGDSCTVRIARAGTYPYYCWVHAAQGMRGTIIVGAGGGGDNDATTTTAGSAVVAPPSAASPPPAGRPAIYWAGWGLFAAGALMALVLIGLYVRFSPGFNREKR